MERARLSSSSVGSSATHRPRKLPDLEILRE
ncbi:hypothetical protein AVEN_130055-1, partial [Araneus ventricosus]